MYLVEKWSDWLDSILFSLACNRLMPNNIIHVDKIYFLNFEHLQLVARPFLADPVMKARAKPLLQKALDMNKNYLPAVLLLVDILRDDDETASALKLLKRMVEVQPSTNVYTILGDICTSERDTAQALHYYTQAIWYEYSIFVQYNSFLFIVSSFISMDPNNRKAVNQLMALNEASTDSKGNSSSLFEVISSAREPSEPNGNTNFEMLESPQLTPPNEMLPSLEEEDEELNVW